MTTIMDQKTKDEVERVRTTLEARAPRIAERDRLIAEEESKWSKEIESLESRVHTEGVEIDLGNGASIAIRTCMTGPEGQLLDALEKAQSIETDPSKKEEISAEMIAMVTLNPLITKKWLLENKDKYSPSDVLRVLLGFMEVRIQERSARIKKIIEASTFRDHERRT